MRALARLPRKKRRRTAPANARYTISDNEALALKELVNEWGFPLDEVAAAARMTVRVLRGYLSKDIRASQFTREPDTGDEPWITKSPLTSRRTPKQS